MQARACELSRPPAPGAREGALILPRRVLHYILGGSERAM